MENMTAGEFNDMHRDFMEAVDDEIYRQGYMNGCPPYYRSAAWHECLLIATLSYLGRDLSLRQMDIMRHEKRKEVALCRMFIKGRVSFLSKQGKSAGQ